jgi:hypothetical protein
MHSQVAAVLEHLAKACQTVALNQNDWEQLYEVALLVHAHAGVDSKAIKRYLMDQGCSIQKAGFLSRQVLHLCTVLKMYDERRSQTAGG